MRRHGSDEERRRLGQRLREIRKSLRMNQAEAVEKIGLSSVPHLSQIECGHKMPTPPTLKKFADAYGVDAEEISALAGYSRRTEEPLSLQGDEQLQSRLEWALNAVLSDKEFSAGYFFKYLKGEDELDIPSKIKAVQMWQFENQDKGLRLMTDEELKRSER